MVKWRSHWQRRACGLLGLVMLLSLALPTVAIAQNRQPQNLWADLWRRLIRSRDREKPRTSRGFICPVMPQLLERRSLWHNHPTFVWQGTVDSVAVAAFADPETPIWTVTTLSATHTVVYTGKALQPGKRYIWKATAAGEQAQVIFELLEQPLRDRITAQLAQLETQLQQQTASPDERVRQRVAFFLDQGLFLDAVQELYSVPQPSQAVQALQNKLVQAVCDDRAK